MSKNLSRSTSLSASEDSEEDPEIVQKMAMLSNKLQYLAKKNRRFLSRSSNHKSSRKEEKGCFNCKKTGHFIPECPDLQNVKSKDKSKKAVMLTMLVTGLKENQPVEIVNSLVRI